MNNEEDLYVEMFDSLYSITPEEYWKNNIPSKLDNDIFTNSKKLLSLKLSSLIEFHSLIETDDDAKIILEIFCNRMASYAVRENNKEAIKCGLTMLSVLPSKDVRNKIILFSLFYHAAAKIGVSPNELFTDVAKKLGAKTKKSFVSRKMVIVSIENETFSDNCNELISFSIRKAKDQSIDSMGYEEGDGLGGFLFKPDSSWG